MPPRTAWNSPAAQPLPMKLPPLEAQQDKLRYELTSAPPGQLQGGYAFDGRSQAPSFEPFNIALTHQGRQTDVIQERLIQLESRVMTAERQAAEASRFLELQGQRMSSLASEVSPLSPIPPKQVYPSDSILVPFVLVWILPC